MYWCLVFLKITGQRRIILILDKIVFTYKKNILGTWIISSNLKQEAQDLVGWETCFYKFNPSSIE